MSVWALGINHTTAPLDLRGRFAFALDQIEPTLDSLRRKLSDGLRDSLPAPEAAIISTCNRTEIYCAGDAQALQVSRAAALADLPDDDWQRFLCVEAAAIGTPVTLAPGQEWVARQGFAA